jgi:hypothetical protein
MSAQNPPGDGQGRPGTAIPDLYITFDAVVGRRTGSDILHADPRALPVVCREQHFLVVASRVRRGLDDQETVHSRIQASCQVLTGHVVAVIPAVPLGFGVKV